jgi:hypothetical protein
MASEPTGAFEYDSPIASPVQRRRLLYEPDIARDSSGSIVELEEACSIDGLDLPAGPSSWGAGQGKLTRGKSKLSGIGGKGSPLTAQNGSHKSRLGLEEDDETDMVMADRHNWATNGKRPPSDRSWLRTRSPDIEAYRSKGSSENNGLDSHPPNGTVLSSKASRRCELEVHGDRGYLGLGLRLDQLLSFCSRG